MFQGTPFYEGQREQNGFQQLTSLSSSTALTVPAGSVYAIINAESQSVRFRADGTAPTASVGVVLAAGSLLFYSGSLEALRFIETAASAKLNVQYFK